jgi:hypothetical protein
LPAEVARNHKTQRKHNTKSHTHIYIYYIDVLIQELIGIMLTSMYGTLKTHVARNAFCCSLSPFEVHILARDVCTETLMALALVLWPGE